MDRVSRRTQVLNNHQTQTPPPDLPSLNQNVCLAFSPAELTEQSLSDTAALRNLTDGHNMEDCDWLYGLMVQSKLFNPRKLGSRVFVSPDFNQSMEGEMTMKRIEYLLERGVFEGFLTGTGIDAQKRKFAFLELVGMFDHSLAIKLGVHFSLWGGAVKFFGTKRHHEKWLRATENYLVKGCFAVTELGHGSNVPGIETIATYDTKTGEPIYRGVDTISLAVWCKKVNCVWRRLRVPRIQQIC